MENVNIVVIGAGAAGMMCAAEAGRTGQHVVLLDHAEKIGEKIRISGGGRCNFTNVHASPAQFLSENPHFCRSALARYTPKDFLDLLASYGVRWHEKHRGQLFCTDASEAIVNVLRAQCERAKVDLRFPVTVRDVRRATPGDAASGFLIDTDRGVIAARACVIATGGLPVPKIGATDQALQWATQWGIPVIAPSPALVPLTFATQEWAPFASLAGISLEVGISTGAGKQRMHFVEDLLLTHRGLSGPAVLQISSYWSAPAEIEIDLLPGRDVSADLLAAKAQSRKQLATLLSEWLPARLATLWVERMAISLGVAVDARLADLPDKALRYVADALQHWRVRPAGTEGWRKAEVMRGGVSTKALSSTTMEVKAHPGLYFIGEAVDVTGWLGGYNFQWAWASGVAAGQAAAASLS